MKYIGMDVHKKFCYMTIMDQEGNKIGERRFPTIDEELNAFAEDIGDAKVVVEASTTGLRVYEHLDEMGVDICMAHPLKVKAIADAKVKTDKIDSEVLAHLLRANLIPEAYVPPREIRDLRSLVRHRAALTIVQTSIKNRIHSILTREGAQYSFSDLFGKAGTEFLKTVELRKQNRTAVDNFLIILDTLRLRIDDVSEQIDKEVGDNKDAELLANRIKGLGRYTSLLVATEIGDVTRFSIYKKLSSYAGLIPSTSSSGGVTRHGKITKRGNKLLRWALIQAAWRVIRYDEKLRGYYQRIAKKRGKNVAIVATARKLLKKIYFTLQENQVYGVQGV
jgi:transposase